MQERENQTGSSAEEPRVRVMSEDEARDYQGVTIEERKEDGEQRVEEPQDRYGRADDLRGSGIRIHTFGTTGSRSCSTRRGPEHSAAPMSGRRHAAAPPQISPVFLLFLLSN